MLLIFWRRILKNNILNNPTEANNEKLLNRVPQIVFIYWVIKIAATTLGETGADMFSMTLNLGYGETIIIFLVLFIILLSYKIKIKKYEPIAYWLVFTSTAIVGTGISDFIDRTLGIGYTFGSILLIFLLLIILMLWYQKEKSIAVENITSTSAEIYYWIAFLIANTLGTAAGDFLSDSLGLGFLISALLITILLVIIIFLHFYSKLSKTFLFWFAFVLTRPFGATFGDLLTKSVDKGGLNLGTIGASIFFTILLIFGLYKEVQLEKVRNL
ncbi:MAG: hypothetical protein HYS24_09850 [Ignavibacteriales bacterium]|jgi:uncharacterized membrane-anchored protein|nr:hypothetical protein [Ignavibacteriales bacterium]